MKKFSFLRNIFLRILLLFCGLSACIFAGCYSFTGGSAPEHLKTLSISAVVDNSGFGNPNYRQFLATELTDKFEKDNTFDLVDRNADAKLSATITTIRESALTVEANELESERKVDVSCSVEYYDAVNKKNIWTKTFSSFDTYDVANISSGRDLAVQTSLEQIADDILLAVVSGW